MKKTFSVLTICILILVPLLFQSPESALGQTYTYNPFTGKLDAVGSSGGGGGSITISGTAPIVVTGGGGATPAISATLASNAEALAGTSNVVLMTPLRTKELFDANNLPATTGLNGVFLTFIDTAVAWTYKLIIPPSGDQIVDNAADTITMDRHIVNATPNSNYTLTSTPSLSAGDDGETSCIRNNGTGTLTLQDKDTLTGSGLNLVGATSLAIAVGEVACFLSNSANWELIGKSGGSSSVNRVMFSWASTSNAPTNAVAGHISISGSTSSGANNDTRHSVMPYAGVLKNLSASIGSAQGGSFSMVCETTLNGSVPANPLAFTVAAADGAETVYHDNTHTVTVAKGDLVSLRCVGGGSGTNATIASGSITLEY